MSMITISPEIIAQAVEARKVAPRFTGYVTCARVYIQFVSRISAGTRKTLAANGFRMMPRPNDGIALYMGYDNATGIEYGQAIAVAKVFNAAGIACYEDTDQD